MFGFSSSSTTSCLTNLIRRFPSAVLSLSNEDNAHMDLFKYFYYDENISLLLAFKDLEKYGNANDPVVKKSKLLQWLYSPFDWQIYGGFFDVLNGKYSDPSLKYTPESFDSDTIQPDTVLRVLIKTCERCLLDKRRRYYDEHQKMYGLWDSASSVNFPAKVDSFELSMVHDLLRFKAAVNQELAGSLSEFPISSNLNVCSSLDSFIKAKRKVGKQLERKYRSIWFQDSDAVPNELKASRLFGHMVMMDYYGSSFCNQPRAVDDCFSSLTVRQLNSPYSAVMYDANVDLALNVLQQLDGLPSILDKLSIMASMGLTLQEVLLIYWKLVLYCSPALRQSLSTRTKTESDTVVLDNVPVIKLDMLADVVASLNESHT